MRSLRTPLLIATLFGAISSAPAAAQQAKASLYQRIGGYDAIAAVTDDFIPRLATDPLIKPFFAGLSKDSGMKLRQHVVELVCMATGGPCFYHGRDMKTAHTGLGITEAQWEASSNHFVATLDKFKVPAAEKAELLAIVGGLKKDIVEKK
jgi:hemoglobin